MNRIRRVGAIFAALALAALIVSPALATNIKDTQVPTTAANAPQGTSEECAGFTQEGMVLWHFVLTGAPSGQTITLTATFNDGDGNPVAPMTATGVEADHSGTYHFEIVTPDNYTLTGASTNVDGDQLLLSHVCFGSPPPEVPEAPIAMLLPLGALLVLGAYLLKHRREASLSS